MKNVNQNEEFYFITKDDSEIENLNLLYKAKKGEYGYNIYWGDDETPKLSLSRDFVDMAIKNGNFVILNKQ